MPKAKKKGLEGHKDYRGKLCVVCLKKSSNSLTPNLIGSLRQHTSIFDSISPEDERVPTGICEKCRNILRSKVSGKGPNKDFDTPSNFSFFSDVVLPKTRSASDNDCNCFICKTAQGFKGFKSQPTTSSVSSHFVNSKVTAKKSKSKVKQYRCAVCLTLISKGISHDCNDVVE